MWNTFKYFTRQQARRRERERNTLAKVGAELSSNVDEFQWQNGSPLETEQIKYDVPRRTLLKQFWQDILMPERMFCVLLCFVVFAAATRIKVGFVNSLRESSNFEAPQTFEEDVRYNSFYGVILDWGYTSEDMLQHENSPQARALKWLSDEDVDTVDHDVARTRFALATIYFSTNNIAQESGTAATWHKQSHWLSSLPVCVWHGVDCVDEDDSSGRVAALNLSSNGLAGTIALEIGLLETDLRILDLGNNTIKGPIPKSIGALENLEQLFLGINYITGTLPMDLLELSMLKHLFINDNELSGTIPHNIGETLTDLQALGLYHNFLESTIPLNIGDLKDLHILYLDNNNLVGGIPTSFGALDSLVDLRLRRNHLSGTIPTVLGNLSNCRILYLDNNHFTGSIPWQIGRQGLLRELHLYQNELTGSLPDELMSLQLMNVMYLDNNNLSGTIPKVIGKMKYLEALYLDRNRLSGSLPAEMGGLKSIEKLKLQSNLFSVRLPRDIAECQNLQELFLNNNNFTGDIPEELETLSSLKKLRLYKNDLISHVPDVFCTAIGESLEEFTADCKKPNPKLECDCCSKCY